MFLFCGIQCLFVLLLLIQLSLVLISVLVAVTEEKHKKIRLKLCVGLYCCYLFCFGVGLEIWLNLLSRYLKLLRRLRNTVLAKRLCVDVIIFGVNELC